MQRPLLADMRTSGISSLDSVVNDYRNAYGVRGIASASNGELFGAGTRSGHVTCVRTIADRTIWIRPTHSRTCFLIFAERDNFRGLLYGVTAHSGTGTARF